MDNSQLQKIKDIIASSEKVGIAVGENPTVDEMAAALSLYLSLTQANKAVVVASPTAPIVELSSLVGIDQVQTDFASNAGDLVVSFPYREGEIEKVSYTIDDEKSLLNIIVKAGEQGLNFDEKDVVYTRGAVIPNLLFVVGTPQLANLGTLFSPDELKDTTIINIDNKADNQKFGDMVLVSPKFSSVAEQVADLIFALNLPVELDTAQNLLSGISYATNNFQDPKTSYVAFEIAAMLMKRGAQRSVNTRGGMNITAPITQPAPVNPMPAAAPKQQPQQNQPKQQHKAPDFGSFMPSPDFRKQNQQKQVEQRAEESRMQNRQQPQQQNQPKREEGGKNPPADWLTPKVYSGSTKV